MRFIGHQNSDGKLVITLCFPKENIEQQLGKLTDEEYEKHCWERSVPHDAINPRWVSIDDFPKEDREEEFFGAWEDTGKKITVNLSKAKDIKIEKIRRHRNLLLKEKYDGLLNRALEIGTEYEIIEIKKKKQQLRDATDALKKLKPKTLQDIRDAAPVLENIENIEDIEDILEI